MNRKTALVLAAFLMTISAFAQPSQQDFERYVEKYKELAIREMQRAGVPASIKLGQALLESDAGRSDLARRANNHFGIKCNNDWDGKTFKKKDDDYNDEGEHIESCFRVYEDAESSYRAHSEFLRNPKKRLRYGPLFELEPTDYKGWAEGLRKAGYATSPTYSKVLIEVIERYRLYKYDHMTRLDKSDEPIANNSDTDLATYLVTNDVKYVLAREKEPVAEIARRTQTSVQTLTSYNENIEAATQELEKDTKVYLQPKRSAYRGKETYHTVRRGETMFEIAQDYGLKLDKLYERNRMNTGMEVAYNEKVKLKGGKISSRPKLASEVPQIELPIIIPKPEPKDTITTQKPATTMTSTRPVKEETVVVAPNTSNELPEITPVKPQPESRPTQPPVVTIQKPSTTTGTQSGPSEEFEEDPFDVKPKPSVPVSNPVVTQFHTVAKGDTLWNVSQRYGLTVSDLKRLNNMSSDGISLGMKLRVK